MVATVRKASIIYVFPGILEDMKGGGQVPFYPTKMRSFESLRSLTSSRTVVPSAFVFCELKLREPK